MSLDELHENTYKHKEEKRLLMNMLSILLKRRLVFDEYKLDTKFYTTLVSAILKDQR